MSKLNYAHVVALVAVLGFALLPGTAARAALILYYPLNEGTGTVAHDQSASGNTGTVGGGSWTAPGESGSGYAASVTAESATAVGVTTGSNIALGSGNFTVSLWFKGAQDSGWRYLVGDGPAWKDPANQGLFIATYDYHPNHLRIGMGSFFTDVVGGTTTFNDTSWYNVVLVRNGTALTAYVNGAVDGTGTSSVTISSNPIHFGSLLGDIGQLTGAVDDIAIWNQALTPGQVAAIAAGASPLTIIPEPSMLVLAGLGLAAATWRKRK